MLERGTQLGPATVNAAPHRSKLDPQRGRDLFVRQTFDVTEHDRRAKLWRQRVQRSLHVGFEPSVVHLDVRAWLAARKPLRGVVGQWIEAHALPAPHQVEEQICGDAVQPTLERAGRIGRQ